MTKEITAQIAALYLGQECDCVWKVNDPAFAIKVGDITANAITTKTIKWLQKRECIIVPHLRRLESLTEAEARELFEAIHHKSFDESVLTTAYDNALDYFLDYVSGDTKTLSYFLGTPAAWLYILSKGFDLFGLIDAGLAKEASK